MQAHKFDSSFGYKNKGKEITFFPRKCILSLFGAIVTVLDDNQKERKEIVLDIWIKNNTYHFKILRQTYPLKRNQFAQR